MTRREEENENEPLPARRRGGARSRSFTPLGRPIPRASQYREPGIARVGRVDGGEAAEVEDTPGARLDAARVATRAAQAGRRRGGCTGGVRARSAHPRSGWRFSSACRSIPCLRSSTRFSSRISACSRVSSSCSAASSAGLAARASAAAPRCDPRTAGAGCASGRARRIGPRGQALRDWE